MKKIFGLSTIAFFAASAAFGGSLEPVVPDVVPTLPAPAPMAVDWSGFYVGGTGGWMMGDSEDYTVIPSTLSNFDGLIYGGFAGYNYQMDSGLVLGAEVAAFTGTMQFAPPDLGITLFDLKARVGYAAGDALIYASGGYTMASYGNGDAGSGWNLGVGLDYMLTDNIFVGGEYVYRDITDSQNTPEQWEDRFGTIQARIGIRF
jgi:outer membrane immunogenic protein